MGRKLAQIARHISRHTLQVVRERQLEGSYEKLSQMSLEQAKVKLNLKKIGIPFNPELFINPKDRGLSADLYTWGFREPINTLTIYNFLRREKQNIDAVIDIGANVGYFAVIARLSKIKTVLAIEPVPETFAVLKRNAEGRNIKALNVAISDKEVKLKMYVPENFNRATPVSSALGTQNIKYVMTVQATTLKKIIKQENLENANVVVRMDLEGYEKKVIDTLPDNIYALLFEFHIPVLGYQEAKQLLQTIKKNGFDIEYLIDNPKGYTPVVKYTSLKTYLQLSKIIGKKRLYYRPKQTVIERLLQAEKACPEILAKRKNLHLDALTSGEAKLISTK